MLLLITYDLNTPGKDYNGLYEEIKKAGWWWHHLDSTWIIRTQYDPKHWYERLSSHLDQNDGILIIEVTRHYYGRLPAKAWAWLTDAFNRE
jgi:hypothetical protein